MPTRSEVCPAELRYGRMSKIYKEIVSLATAITIGFIIQFLHVCEELATDFYKRTPLLLCPRSFPIYLLAEGLLLVIFASVVFSELSILKAFLLLLMFGNGVWHLGWASIERKYVPGLITGLLHISNGTIYFLLLHS